MNFINKEITSEIYEANNCGICLEILEKTNFCVIKCGHKFCLKCIIKNNNYNNCCPYCRIKIIDIENNNNEEENNNEENNNEENNNEEENNNNVVNQFVYGRSIDDCYYFPVVIENIQSLTGVINEVTGGTISSERGIGWILGILSLINDNEETKFNFNDDKSFENNILEAEYYKLIINEVIFIYKRSILLKKMFGNKF
jgi:hypothetical protein